MSGAITYLKEHVLLGRKTYEGFAAAWPSMKDEAGFADKMNGMRKFVVSSTLQSADWNNSTILKGGPAQEIERLKQQPGGDLLVAGSNQLVGTLLGHQLVDELRLMIYPVVLGAGKRLFGEGLPQQGFEIHESQRSQDVLLLTLRPATRVETAGA